LKIAQLEIQLSNMAADRIDLKELIAEENEKQSKLDYSSKGKYQIDLDNIDSYINDNFKDSVRNKSLKNEKIDHL
jgi:hypothetical protein